MTAAPAPVRPRSRWRTASPYVLGVVLVLAGLNHFVSPGFYDAQIPTWLGDARAWTLGSGVAEVAVGLLVLVPRTRRLGGLAAFALFVAVFPGNVTSVVRADGTAELVGTLLRLPFQVPLLLWAWQVQRDAEPAAARVRA